MGFVTLSKAEKKKPCWDGYEMVGTKMQNGKKVPNCVPISSKAEYQGKKVKLNKPFRAGDGKSKFAVYVTNKKGNVVKVRFGSTSMGINRDDPAARRSFRARHKCDTAKDKTTARYWSCKMWSSKNVSDIVSNNTEKATVPRSLRSALNKINEALMSVRNAYVKAKQNRNRRAMKEIKEDWEELKSTRNSLRVILGREGAKVEFY